MIKKSSDPERLPIFQFDLGLRLSSRERWNGKARNSYSVGIVQRADFGGNMKADDIVILNVSCEIQPNPVRPKLDGNGTGSGATLDDRKGKLTSGKETGLLPANRHEIRLRQNLED